jgi:hypothetical protein
VYKYNIKIQITYIPYKLVFYLMVTMFTGEIQFNHRERKEGTKDTKLKPCNSVLCDLDVKGGSLAPSLKLPTGAIAHSGPSLKSAKGLIF